MQNRLVAENINVSKKYIFEESSNARRFLLDPFADNEAAISQAISAILRDIFESQHLMVAPEDEIKILQNCLLQQDSPEKILSDYLDKHCLETINHLKTVKLRLEKQSNQQDAEQKRKEIKKAIDSQLITEINKIVTNLPLKMKRELAQSRHERRMRDIMTTTNATIKKEIDKLSDNEVVSMNLYRVPDPLYSLDMVQHLIRLRLNDPTPLQKKYPASQSPIVKDNRIWIGCFQLCDLKGATNLAALRVQLRNEVTQALEKLSADQRKQEIVFSIRSYQPNGGGHYQLLSLVPDAKAANGYIIRSVNSIQIPLDAELNDGMQGELLAAATAAHFNITRFEPVMLISQQSNHACGPTHVEIVSAVMTQQCAFGSVAKDYTLQKAIQPTKEQNDHAVDEHCAELLSNPISREALQERGREEFIFSLMPADGKQFDGIPPTLQQLQAVGIGVKPVVVNPIQETKIEIVTPSIQPIVEKVPVKPIENKPAEVPIVASQSIPPITKQNFMRRHYGKMLVGALIISAIAFTIAAVVATLGIAAIVTVAALILGVGVGAMIGKIQDARQLSKHLASTAPNSSSYQSMLTSDLNKPVSKNQAEQVQPVLGAKAGGIFEMPGTTREKDANAQHSLNKPKP